MYRNPSWLSSFCRHHDVAIIAGQMFWDGRAEQQTEQPSLEERFQTLAGKSGVGMLTNARLGDEAQVAMSVNEGLRAGPATGRGALDHDWRGAWLGQGCS